MKKEYLDKDYFINFFQTLYPVGALYLSTNDTNPASLFGFGIWEQIQDVFLLASGKYSSSGSVGGNENHTLTINEMPSHTHGLTDTVAWPLVDDPEREWGVHYYTASGQKHPYTQWINTTRSTGEGQPFSIMPPYLSVNIWKRIG